MNEPKVIMSLMFFTMSFGFYGFSALFFALYWFFKKDWIGQAAMAMTYIALISTTMFLIMRAAESGHAPFSNLFESMLLFIWAMTVLFLILERRYRVRVTGFFVMVIALLAMVSASQLPYRYKSVGQLNPALQSKWHWMKDLLRPLGLENYAIGWLDFHVFTTFISYGGFAIAFGLSIMYLMKKRSESRPSSNVLLERLPDSETLDELSYLTIAWGFPFLAVGIVTGAMWADYAWGTYWSWDPKETWSLITWLIYAVYLHARVTRGWRGKRAAYISIIGFLAVIFLYWGVSFILPGLHAYA